MKAEKRHQIEIDIAAIGRGYVPARPPVSRPLPSPLPTAEPELALSEPFGEWLLAQRDRGDWIDDLADTVRQDLRFPKRASPDDVRRHLIAMGVEEPDVYEQVDDAERIWRSL